MHPSRLVCSADRLTIALMHHMGRDQAISAALQLQHDAGLIMLNLQVLGQFVTSLNRMSSEVMQLAFAHEPFPSAAVQSMAPSHRSGRHPTTCLLWVCGVRQVPQGAPGPLPTSSCNACMMCSDCFPDLLKFVVCWSLTSLCHSNGHIETMLAREMNPFTALTRIRSQFLRTQ